MQQNILVPKDAFSHGQIKSKIWLVDSFNEIASQHIDIKRKHTLSWYGSWIGLGPFIFLLQSKMQLKEIRLFDINQNSLDASKNILNFWLCEGILLNTFCEDINNTQPIDSPDQIFVNTSCEHIVSNDWIKKIPIGSYVILQSTDMRHIEHVNSPKNLDDFIAKYASFVEIYSTHQLPVSYDDCDFRFTRYMLFGRKK